MFSFKYGCLNLLILIRSSNCLTFGGNTFRKAPTFLPKFPIPSGIETT